MSLVQCRLPGRIRTWVMLQRRLAVRLFDLVGRRVAAEAEDLVWFNDRRLRVRVVFEVRHVGRLGK